MKIKLNINGKEIEAEVDKDSIKEALNNEPVKKKRWRAGMGVRYFYTDSAGEVINCNEGGYDVDTERHELGNYHETEEEVIDARDKKLAIQRVEDYIIENDMEFEPNWNDRDQGKYEVYHDLRDSPNYAYFLVCIAKTAMVIPYLSCKEHCNKLIEDCQEDLNIIFKIND